LARYRFHVLVILAVLPAAPVLWGESVPGINIEAAVDLTRGAPPELASDALIRLASLDRLEKNRRIELLNQAFEMAAGSAQNYKRRAAAVQASGPSGFLERAYAQDLDALSLRLRAIEGLLLLDPRVARQRFEEIGPLRLPPLGCQDFLVYDVSRFYQVLGKLTAESFNAKEAREGEPGKFLARYVGVIASPAEITPAARLLASAVVPDSDFQLLATAFAGALSRIMGDDRSFTYAVREAGAAIEELAKSGERRTQLSPAVLLSAYRTFLVNHLSAARCEPLDSNGDRDPAGFFNDRLRISLLPPIGEAEQTPSKVEGKATGLTWCESPECRAIRDQFHSVVFTPDGEAFRQEQREKNEWQARVRDFLAALSLWDQSANASPADYFREKIGFYGDLLAIVPNGETREYVLRSMLAFLIQSRPRPEERIEWYLPIVQLVGRVALDPLGLGKLASDLRQANDPAIALEMAVEQIAPHPVNEFMLLL
jgi:hypothetical protein